MSEAEVTVPDQAQADWKRLHPLSILLGAIAALGQAIIPLAFVIFGSSAQGFQFLWIALAVLGILTATQLFAYLRWRKLQYLLGAQDIRLEKGIIGRTARSVPYERIQDVSLEQKLLPRIFGLAEVRFETGAGGKDELKLSYVSLAEGERLREVVRDRKAGGAAQQSQAAHSPEEVEDQAEPLFAMDSRRLFTFGLFEFSLVVLAVLGALLQQAEGLVDFAIWDVDFWRDQVAGQADWVSSLGWISRIIGIISLIISLFVLGMISGIVRTFLRDWEFRLEETPKGFRRRRGLLTKTDVVMPAHRVQALSISTGLIRRIWGWHGLSFISLAQDAKSANHVVAPFAQMEEIAPIVKAAHFTLPPEDQHWHRPSTNYRVDGAIWSAIIPVLVGLGIIAFSQPIWIALLLFVLAGLLAARQFFLWRYERHALDMHYVFSRRGWLVPKLSIASRVKLHSVEISQGPIAKRRGYANLNFGLAGGTLSFPGLDLGEAEMIRKSALSSIAALDFSKLPK